MCSLGALSCESHWLLFPSKETREDEREEVKVKVGLARGGGPRASLELALPIVMFPASGVCGQDFASAREDRAEAEPLRWPIHPRPSPIDCVHVI